MNLQFSNESLFEIANILRSLLEQNKNKVLEFTVLNPDIKEDVFSGEVVNIDGETYIYRSLKTWLDLAERLDCKFLIPRTLNDIHIQLRYQPIDTTTSWHQKTQSSTEKKYGVDSQFARINKLEEPHFLLDYIDALKRLDIKEDARILNFGINKADEFVVFEPLFGQAVCDGLEFVGIDLSGSAIDYAKQRFPQKNFRFICYDINQLNELDLDRFDVIISVGTLQSSGLKNHSTFRRLVQDYLAPQGSLILGIPNSRYLGYDIKYGAKMKNFQQPDLSLLVKDIAYYKRYLQQHKFKTFVTGKYYLFLTAIAQSSKE